MKKTYRMSVKYATKGFNTILAGNDTQTKIINELLYVAVLFVFKCDDAQVVLDCLLLLKVYKFLLTIIVQIDS